MDWLTFIAELVKAVAWPVTLVIIFFMLRRPLINLIPLVQRFRFFDFELDFGRQVQELAVELRRELPATIGIGAKGQELRTHYAQLATLSPRAVILEAWLQLEEAAIEASRRHNLDLTSREMRSPILLGASLEQAGILDEPKAEIFHRLRNLRNAAAHASEFQFDPEAALEYSELAIRLAEFLRHP